MPQWVLSYLRSMVLGHEIIETELLSLNSVELFALSRGLRANTCRHLCPVPSELSQA